MVQHRHDNVEGSAMAHILGNLQSLDWTGGLD